MLLLRKVSVYLCLFSLCMSVALYPLLPSQVATHWNINGTADEHTTKIMAGFLIPVLMVFLFKVSDFTMRYIYGTSKRNCTVHAIATNTVLSFLLFIHVLILLIGTGIFIDFQMCLLAAAGAFFLVLSWCFAKIQTREPVTAPFVSTETVFQKMQMHTVRTFCFIGFGLLVSLILPQQWQVYTAICMIGFGGIFIIIMTLYYYTIENRN
ncbi:DUF1648 domain-containing protein [Bacillus sp. OTU530]|uniref:DUF1648 domain-containing protein n=1 Tax=Bacillus sp. OTU530 TaxID=3043862 RepID=UPI00313DE008